MLLLNILKMFWLVQSMLNKEKKSADDLRKLFFIWEQFSNTRWKVFCPSVKPAPSNCFEDKKGGIEKNTVLIMTHSVFFTSFAY